MFKKIALLASMAAFVVACGPSQAEMEAQAKAVADSISAVLRADSMRMADEAAAAAAAAQVQADSVAAAAAAAAAAVPTKK
ncbi:MAG: hypothetical protein IPP83_19665 [Flavobacteriales bacterium]|nr:hypothetical protein [Flavobacteriales bacterium]